MTFGVLKNLFAPRRITDSGEDAHVVIDGRRFDYSLRRSPRRRSISLLIDERGLRVAAPVRATRSAIDAVLHEHRSWIQRKVGEWEAKRPPPRCWDDGARIMFMGAALRIEAREGAIAPFRDGERLCYGPQGLDPAEIEMRVIAWLRQQALLHFSERCSHYSNQLGISNPVVRLSNARTRWGSCHAGGRIRMNWRLIQAPPAWIDYVAAHEVAHLRHMNHSPSFWKTVADLVPDHVQRRAELRRDAHRYLLL